MSGLRFGLTGEEREALAEALDDHRRGESERDCIEGAWVWACWCECDWRGRDRDHLAHVVEELAPTVERIVAARVEGAVRLIVRKEGAPPIVEAEWLLWALGPEGASRAFAVVPGAVSPTEPNRNPR